MIEIIYQGEEEGLAETKTDLKLPKNVRQIGDVGQENKKIYVEDFVMSYVKHFSSRNLKYGVLLGNVIKHSGNTYFFISGAVCAKPVIDNEIIFDEDVWTGIYENIKNFFDNVEIVGWFLSIPGMLAGDMANIQKIHLDNFAGNDKVCFVLDRIECEDTFHIYSDGGMKKIEGHYIYYEKNVDMQSYMVVNEDINEVPAEYEQSKKRSINATVHRLLYRIDRESGKEAGEIQAAQELEKSNKKVGKNNIDAKGEETLKKKNRKNKQNKNDKLNEKLNIKYRQEKSVTTDMDFNDEKSRDAKVSISGSSDSEMKTSAEKSKEKEIHFGIKKDGIKDVNIDAETNNTESIRAEIGKNSAKKMDEDINKNGTKMINNEAKGKIGETQRDKLNDNVSVKISEKIKANGKIRESEIEKQYGVIADKDKVELNVRQSKNKNENKVIPEVINEKIMIDKPVEDRKKQAPLFAYSASSFILIAILLGAISVVHTSGQIKDIKNMVSKMANATVVENPENTKDNQNKVGNKNGQDKDVVDKEGNGTVEIVDVAADVTTSGASDNEDENSTTENTSGQNLNDGKESGDGTQTDTTKQDKNAENETQKDVKQDEESSTDQQNSVKESSDNQSQNGSSNDGSNNENKQEETPASVEPQYYTVKKGDSLYSISKLVYGDINMIDKIREANHMSDTDENITIGQRLILP